MTKLREIEHRANELLERNKVLRAPVPLEKIAKSLGIEVRYSEAADDISGALVRNGDSVIVAVNSAHHENRQRFTIAHEIGHFQLHERAPQVHFDNDFRVRHFRDSRSSEASDVYEIEANRFAAALLMPDEFLKRDCGRMDVVTEDVLTALAAKYKVSRRAMELRLLNLGYISPCE